MHRVGRLAPWIFAMLLLGPGANAQDPPGVNAPDREKLDYLFSSWRGQSLENLQAVWGREEFIDENNDDSKTYGFERARRGPAVGLGGIRVVGRGNIVCNAYFRIGLEGIVTRATWRGPSADDCWRLFRDSAPPAAP